MSQTLEKWRENIAQQENAQQQLDIDKIGGGGGDEEYDEEEDVY